jgi:3-hydroxyisobutyrate dehydrogenase
MIGTGRMGAAMVGRLVGGGHQVTGYNRTRARAEALGTPVAGTPREAVAGAEVVLVSLADDAAVEAVYRGGDGLLAGLAPGAVVVETSTVDPGTVRALAPLVDKAGGTLLDAPVSGSVSVVESGQLTFMVGGDPAALDRVRPVLAPLAVHVFHLGDQGAGATMKLVVNSLIAELNGALCEGLVLAEKAGIARPAAYEVFAASAVAAPFVHYKRAAFEHPEKTPPAFTVSLLAKDVRLILDLAGRVGARMAQLTAEQTLLAEAEAAGYGQRDLTGIADFLRGRDPA